MSTMVRENEYRITILSFYTVGPYQQRRVKRLVENETHTQEAEEQGAEELHRM